MEKKNDLPRCLMGAIIGDIAGSRFEFRNTHSTDFTLFTEACSITDDTIMTLAVAEAFTLARESERPLFDLLTERMQTLGRRHPASYGRRFSGWLRQEDPRPYNSLGNGAPMRCSAAGWITDDAERAFALGVAAAEPTHNHEEAMLSAGVTAALICMARNGADKENLRAFVEARGCTVPTIASLRGYRFSEASRDTMPAVFAAFFESESFEDCIRRAVAIGGDSDTIAAIAGSVAEAYYGVPEELTAAALRYLPDDLLVILENFQMAFAL